MSELTIRTNHAWRDFVYRSDVPAKVLESEFDYQDEEDTLDGFFCYRGCWYHLDQFMVCDGDTFKGWHAYLSDSFYSGVLIRVSNDGERYQVGTFYS